MVWGDLSIIITIDESEKQKPSRLHPHDYHADCHPGDYCLVRLHPCLQIRIAVVEGLPTLLAQD